MNASWKAGTRYRSIASLLIAAILFVTLMPAHYHLHHLHSGDADIHEHAIDLHLITANIDQSHHDEDTSIFSATPDVIVKKINNDILTDVVVALLLVLLTVFYRLKNSRGNCSADLKRQFPYFTPPLRAPPLS